MEAFVPSVCSKSLQNRLYWDTLKYSIILRNLCGQPVLIFCYLDKNSRVCRKRRPFYPPVVLDFSLTLRIFKKLYWKLTVVLYLQVESRPITAAYRRARSWTRASRSSSWRASTSAPNAACTPTSVWTTARPRARMAGRMTRASAPPSSQRY